MQSGLATNASGSTTAQQSQTDTPTINSLSCEQIGSTYYLSASIKNNDASSVTMEASRSSNFMPKVTSSYTGGQTKTITVSTSSSSFDGTQTVYARATASGETLSNSTSKTQSVSCGGLGGFG